MKHHRVVRTLRRNLLHSAAPAGLAAAMALTAMALAPTGARAADVVCTPNASGTAIASAIETCSGTGDRIKYDTLPATVSSVVNLNGVIITGTAPGVTDAVAINPGSIPSLTILTNGVGSITTNNGNGINVTATAGTTAISVGTAANRINIPLTGGAGINTAQGIFVSGRGDISVYTGNVPITGPSTGGGSWAIRVGDTLAGSSPGGAIIVDTQGPLLAGRGGILATTLGTDTTDTVTVNSTGPITGLQGAGIQTSSVNGNSSITASGAVIGSVGAGTVGISETVTGTGNAALTTLAGGTVLGNGGAQGVLVSTATGGMTVNLGASVTSTDSNAIKATNIGATGVNTITIGAATIRGLGTNTTAAVIDLTSGSGGLITLNTGAGTAILSNATAAAVQNGNLALKATGGSVVFNNAGSVRGVADFSAITVATNSVTFNNAATGNWHTSGTSTFSAGNDAFANNGLLATNGVTTLAFGGGTDTFTNGATGSLFGAETTGASLTSFTGLETFTNAGTVTLVDSETNDLLSLGGAAYVGSGTPKLALDAFLGNALQSTCPAITVRFADCVAVGAVSGASTVVNVTDTNASGPGALNYTGLVLVDATSAGASSFTLGGGNVVNTPQGAAISKGFVQYQLFFDAPNANFVLAGVPAASMMEVGYAAAGLQTIWHNSADGVDNRMTAIRHAYAAEQSSGAPVPAQASGFEQLSFWGSFSRSGFYRDNAQSLGILGTTLNYDTSYSQLSSAAQFGIDTRTHDTGAGSWVLGGTVGYTTSNMRFNADGNKINPSVWSIGGYASYLKKDFFAHMLLKDDIGSVDFVLPASSVNGQVDANSLGGKITIGEHYAGAVSGVDFAPMASLAFVRSNLDNITDPSATFDFGADRSFRGNLSLRVSKDLQDGSTILQPFLLVGINQEFSGANPVNVTSGSTVLTIRDNAMRTFGTGSMGVNVFGMGALSGFVAGDGLWGGDANGWAMRVGLRYAD